jgi:hypothetical protein
LAPEEVSRYPVLCHVEDGRGGYVEVNFDVQVFPQYIPEYEWTIYNRDNSGLPSNLLWDVAITSDDVVWTLDESHDASRFDGTNWLTWDVASWDDGVDLAVDSQGNAWITAAASWIAKADESGFSKISHSGWSYTVAIDKQDNIWVGGRGDDRQARISKYDGTNWTHYDSSVTGTAIPEPAAITFDSNNNLWYISMNDSIWGGAGILTYYDGLNWTTIEGPAPSWPGCIAIDESDRVWVGTYSGELASFFQNEWTLAPPPSNFWPLTDIEILNENEIWCSFEYGGIARANRHSAYLAEDAAWSPVFNTDNSIFSENPLIYSLASDSKGNIWGALWNHSWPSDSSDVALFKLSIIDE